MTGPYKKPVVTLSIPNDQRQFELQCANLIGRGYLLSSSSCTACTNNGTIDYIWAAILVRPEASVTILGTEDDQKLVLDI